jgi:uncharacterized protein DUF3179
VRRLLWVIVLLAAATAVTVVAIPTLTIMPFKPQTTRTLEIAYPLRQIAPALTLVCLVIVAGGALFLVRGPRPPAPPRPVRKLRWFRRPVVLHVTRGVLLTTLIGATAVVTWFCRQNHFEWMFNPLPNVKYVDIAAAKVFLTDDEMVMGIDVNGLSLAYPVRQMAYHHVVNDMLGTTPVVVTY